MAYPSQLGLQDAASPVMEELLHFHDHVLMIVILISVLVLYIIVAMVSASLTNKYILDSQEIEIVWTILPAIILILIALPSLRILYLMDEINDLHLTIKVMGHQWYWSYEYTDYSLLEFDFLYHEIEPNSAEVGAGAAVAADIDAAAEIEAAVEAVNAALDALSASVEAMFALAEEMNVVVEDMLGRGS